MNSNLIIHRDLKFDNIMVSKKASAFNRIGQIEISDFEFKIGDMGLAKKLSSENQMNKSFVGTPVVMAPEVLSHSNYSIKADVWSLGVMLY